MLKLTRNHEQPKPPVVESVTLTLTVPQFKALLECAGSQGTIKRSICYLYFHRDGSSLERALNSIWHGVHGVDENIIKSFLNTPNDYGASGLKNIDCKQ